MPDKVDSIFCASAIVFTGEVFHMNTMLMSGIDTADPIELGGLEAHALRSELFVERHGRRADADDGAVLRRDVEDLVDGEEAAGAGHVLRHDIRLSRNMPADMAGEQAPAGVVAAAGG